MNFIENQSLFSILFSLLFLGLGIRTTLWHIKNWQIREYRCDRMNAYLQTKDGKKEFYNLWFFRGILPRPKLSFRVILILGFLFFVIGVIFSFLSLSSPYSLLASSIVIERTLWCWIALGVRISSLPIFIQKHRLYSRAKNVININKNIVRIGITGSYGKSSTKEVLIYLLENELGKDNVLYNPANNNNEVAIARLILEKSSFFKIQPVRRSSEPQPARSKGGNSKFSSSPNGQKTSALRVEDKIPRVAIFEIGAYCQGEIHTVCNFTQPHIGILTGLNEQHIELFGSQENISKAKFELAESATKSVFFNADNENLNNIFDQRKIKAFVTPISKKLVKNTKPFPDRTEFEWRGEKCVLPWGGEFFVTNALLALETAHEIFDISPKKLAQSLSTLPPLARALNIKNLKNGAALLEDIYSANPDGVLGAIKHLSQFNGKKVFVGIPLRELGKQAESAHEKIFESLHEIGAEVFWLKTDFSELGKNICGENFHLISEDFSHITKVIASLGKEDAVLLESRLPDKLIKSIR